MTSIEESRASKRLGWSLEGMKHVRRDQACHDTHALIKLSHPSLGHRWLISAINFSNVIAFHGSKLLGVHRQEASEGNLWWTQSRIERGRMLFLFLIESALEFRIEWEVEEWERDEIKIFRVSGYLQWDRTSDYRVHHLDPVGHRSILNLHHIYLIRSPLIQRLEYQWWPLREV